MLISSKWKGQRVKLQPLLQKIASVPLPLQQASTILQNLQASCSSSSKAIQLEALKCWENWVQNYNSKELEVDSVCHFAMKPLLTKTRHVLHNDADVCKLKLKIMWGLLMNVQSKMKLSGPRHILEKFLHSCFTWLSSSESLDCKVSVLILKLLLVLFKKCSEQVECDKYIFSPVIIDESTLKMFLINFVENFLDLFDNWKQYQDNYLIIDLWKCFLEHCEVYHNSILTPVWHRVFKLVRVFCSEKCIPIKDRLAFLHACATNVKTVLVSSKCISGEAFFMTPCEALIMKLIEICKTDCDETYDLEFFNMSSDICKVLSYKSISICDYNLCIDLINAMYDFSLKSFFWGCWLMEELDEEKMIFPYRCGLMDCFKKTLMNVKPSELNRSQMKFYRKLRAATVNYELDSDHLHEDGAANVFNNIKFLNIRCFCSLEIPKSIPNDSFLSSDSAAVTKNTADEKSEEINSENNEILPFGSCYKNRTSKFDFGIFGYPFESSANPFNPRKKIINVTFDLVQTILESISVNPFVVVGGRMEIPPFFRLKFVEHDSNRHREKDPIVFSRFFETSSPARKIIFGRRSLEGRKETIRSHEKNGGRKSSEETGKNRDADPGSRMKGKKLDSKEEKGSVMTRKTRSQTKKAEPEMGAKRRKMRKSYEFTVQEIMKNNKLRKAEKNKCDVNSFHLLTGRILDRKELRSGKKIDSSMNRKEKTKKMEWRKNRNLGKEEKKSTRFPFDLRSKQGNGKAEVKEKNFDSKKSKKTNRKNGRRKGKREKNNRKKILVEKEAGEESRRRGKNLRNLIGTGNATADEKECISPEEVIDDGDGGKGILNFNEIPNDDFEKFFESQTTKEEIDSIGKVEKIFENEFALSNSDGVEQNESCREIATNFCPEIIFDPEENISETSGAEEKTETIEAAEKSDLPTFADESNFEEESKSGSETDGKKNEAEEKIDSEIEVETSKVKKRFRTEEESELVEIKKQKTSEEDCRKIERGAEKENVEMSLKKEQVDLLSPPKPIPETEMDNPNGKWESPKTNCDYSPKSFKMAAKRTTSSRALKMISLVPESDSCGFQKINWESSAGKSTECKFANRKYAGIDRSSRISKMLLASLTKMSHEEIDEIAEEDKLTREDSSTMNSSTVKISSPKTAKKRKFISFDESRNETIVFEIDMPPSEILIRRKSKSKENFCTAEETAAIFSSNSSSAT